MYTLYDFINRGTVALIDIFIITYFCIKLFFFQVRDLVPESQAYMDLLSFERKLDLTIMRKRLDIQEALKRPMKVCLKCFIQENVHIMLHSKNNRLKRHLLSQAACQYCPSRLRF